MSAPAVSPSTSIPADTSRFIGRRQQVQRLIKLQTAHKLVTLVGPGGSGKSRLAIRVARRRQTAFAGGVTFVDMAMRCSANDVMRAITSLPTDPARARLLVLDTCDVDVQASGRVVATILRDHPNVSILATSREPLGLRGELVWRVPMLSLADAEPVHARQVQGSEAWQLFVDRVIAAPQDAANLMEHAGAIARICRGLNGLPLAVELMALQARKLGATVLAERVATPFLLSIAGRRDAPARQRTLRASLDWSYARLTDGEQRLLRRVAAFGGDWTMDMAVAISGEAPGDVQQWLSALSDKSLVRASTRGHESRYALLEVTRQFGRELLEACGEAAWVDRHHLEWCVALAELAPPLELDRRHVQRLEREQTELRVALEWAMTSGETELGLRLVTGAFWLWYLRGAYAEGRSWFDRLLAQPLASVSPDVVASARAWRTQLMMQQGDYATAESELKMVIQDQSARADYTASGVSLMLLGNVFLAVGQLERARGTYDEAQRLLESADNGGPFMVFYQAARVAWETSDFARARAVTHRLQQSARFRRPVVLARVQQLEALLASEAGDWNSAHTYLDAAERQLRRIDDAFGYVDLLLDRGGVLLRSGQIRAAHQAYVHAAALARTIGARLRLVRAIEGIACALADSQPGLCVQLAAAAETSRSVMQAVRWPQDQAQLHSALAIARPHLDKLRDTSTAGAAPRSYDDAWRMGTVLLESEAATTAIATLDAQPPSAIADIPATLTSREWEIVQLFAAGTSPRQIAERLTLSRDTVRTHLDRATAKLGLHSRVQLARWATRSDAPG